jgi:hypothetical protein
MAISTAVLLLAVMMMSAAIHALDNGLGARPGLGWNSDYCVNCSTASGGSSAMVTGFQNEEYIRSIADFLHAHRLPNGRTLQELGYEYVNMVRFRTLTRCACPVSARTTAPFQVSC